MKPYIGTKLVKAAPMTWGDYKRYRGFDLPDDNLSEDLAGYLIEHAAADDRGLSNHESHKGYISWSLESAFRQDYRDTDGGLPFGFAIEAMRAGLKLARAGWNGKGMFVYYVPPGRYQPTTTAAREFFGGGLVPYREYIAMKTVDDEVVPWLASQTDILAEDWMIVE